MGESCCGREYGRELLWAHYGLSMGESCCGPIMGESYKGASRALDESSRTPWSWANWVGREGGPPLVGKRIVSTTALGELLVGAATALGASS